ncbi:MAG: CBS domain-containing protein [Acidobacteriota bacterium]
MPVKKAGEIMIPLDRYPHIPHWFSVRQAIAELRASQIDVQGRKSLPRAVLVFSKAYELLGIVRRRDILRGLEPSFAKSDPAGQGRRLFDVQEDPNLFDFTSDRMNAAIREQAERSVSEIMVPISATVDYGDHILKIIYEMVKTDLSMLPVLKEGRVVGVVRSVDVLNEISEIVLA